MVRKRLGSVALSLHELRKRRRTAPSAGGSDDRFDELRDRALSARPLFRPARERNRCAHRVHRRPHHVSDDGLHRVRQPADPGQCGHGQRRGVRRDLSRGGGHDAGDGTLCQLPDCARARHGAQRLLRLHGGARLQIYLAAGPGRGVLLRPAVLPDLDLPHSRIRHQFDTEEPEGRDLRRHRALPRHYRARGSQDRSRNRRPW
jgi:hypothetical protein